ncbi:hypothetical protein [Nakamurella sp. PAMC28650]|uniref:hypothetical protein n=1 Tax=Nakamurella sp. PAMC28650 TaxID=2762325 RepID=UPI00164DE92F|nr:hypothetical protein [Nakamurella sp. PAMC28650]QNK79577.1 hypothetical protein H7F38_14960 [Nakamurella sp. PAMC28650]
MTEFNGLPAHILLIHLVVVGIPVAALLTVLSAVWPAARVRLGIATPVIALLALICVPITTNAGQWLQHHVYIDPKTANGQLILTHIRIGDGLTPWAIGLFVLALAAWGIPHLLGREKGPAVLGSSATKIAVGVLALAIAVVAVIQVYRIGDAGAKAAWSSNFCKVEIAVGTSCPAA